MLPRMQAARLSTYLSVAGTRVTPPPNVVLLVLVPGLRTRRRWRRRRTRFEFGDHSPAAIDLDEPHLLLRLDLLVVLALEGADDGGGRLVVLDLHPRQLPLDLARLLHPAHRVQGAEQIDQER